MGKVKQGKRISAHRTTGDPMGSKVPLADEIESLKLAKSKSNDLLNKSGQNVMSGGNGAGLIRKRQAEEDEFVGDKMTAKILLQARRQQSELQDEYGIGDDDDNDQKQDNNNNVNKLNRVGPRGDGKEPTSFDLVADNNNNNNNDEDNINSGTNFLSRPFKKFQTNFKQQQKIRKSDHDDSDSDSDTDEQLDNGENKRDLFNEEEIQINDDDQKAFDTFMSTKGQSRRTIADIIKEKLTEKKTELASQLTDDESRTLVNGQSSSSQLDERVVKMYSQIKQVLAKYRSGKLPKAFKILPSLNNWEHILYITEPDNWSAAAIYQATRIFASNLNAKMAQRFYNLVLLPRIRDDINEYRRLNFHLYQALRKALFKPAAFFKGILLPLCEDSSCTLREAIIVGSVLAKNSIPMLHSAAALLKLAEMNYSGGCSIFIRILLDKKYALPYRVIDAVVHHFVQFQNDKRELPVLWHQALLTFVQRYKSDISTEQKEALLELLKKHGHFEITNEVRRELANAKCRDLENEDANSQHSVDLNLNDNDDTLDY
jgi:essential nuclear protein 1